MRGSFLGRCLGAFGALQGVDRAMVIASQAFTALIPLLIVVSAAAPAGQGNLVADVVIDRFALTGDAAAAVEAVFAHPGEVETGVLSVLLLLISGITLARRMQRMYVQAWRVEPRAGVQGSFSAALGLGALLLEILLLQLINSLVDDLTGTPTPGAPGAFLASVVLWTTIPWLLLDRRLRWRRLLPGGIVAGACATLYGAFSTVYMPRLFEVYSQRYGLFGVTLALVGWLLSISLIVVVATVVAAELDRAPEPWAQRLSSWLRLERPGRPLSEVPAAPAPSSRDAVQPRPDRRHR